MYDDARQRDEGDEVRDRHKSVDDVGEHPDCLEFQEGTARDEADEHKAVGQDGTHPPEVEDGTLAIVVPAEDGGECQETVRSMPPMSP